MELEQIKAIIGMMKDNDLSEFQMEQDGLKIRIKRGPEGFQQTVTLPPSAPLAAPAPVAVAVPALAPVAPSAAPVVTDDKHIVSPMVGTFYLAPAPDAPTYVEVGQEVDPETVVCIIEAMKVMNEIKAETRGVIAEILAENGKPVQYGQPLFRLK